MTTADEFLMGGGITSAKFPTIGASVTGTIARQPEVAQQKDFTTGQPKFWDNGDPMQQLVVHLDTTERDPSIPDDDGQRAIYVKGNLLKAVREAVRKSGAKGLAVGGHLTVTYTGDGESTKRGFNPPKVYAVAYTPPAAAGAGAFLDQGEPAPQAPAPAAQPAPAGVDPAVLAALGQLTNDQKRTLGLPV